MEFDLENPITTFEELTSDKISALFAAELDHMPSGNHFRIIKALDFDVSIRREAISLILELSCNFDPFTLYLAVNYLDRFTCIQGTQQGKPWMPRLLAIGCLSLAAKMTKTEFVIDFQREEGFIFNTRTFLRMELVILGVLKWRMRSITPFAFICFFLSLFKLKDPPLRQALKARATEIILTTQPEIKLLEFRPSIIAASALLSASHELFPLQFPCFRKAISSCVHVNKENLFDCCNVLQDIAMEGYESAIDLVWSTETPVNVLDRLCSGSESEKTTSSVAITTIRPERDVKRQKISDIRDGNDFRLSQN